MADYYSNKLNSDGTEASGELHVGPNLGIATVSITAGLAINDEIHFFRLFPGYTLVSMGFYFTDLDTNGTPLLTSSVGVESDPDLFVTSTTNGRSAGHLLGDYNEAFYGYEVATEENLIWKVTASAATGVAGTMHCWLLFNT